MEGQDNDVLAAIATFLLTINRSLGATQIAGVPYVVPIVLLLLPR